MRPARVVVAGSVDDGKSTLLGRLMCDAERVFGDEVEAVRKASPDELNLAFFTDGLMLERRDGITLDVAWRHLTLGARRLLLADVPGHADLVHNMATGASTADAALVLVDAQRGIQPQTRRHLVMLSGLGVKRVIVCINKMDAVAFEESVAVRLGGELGAFARALGVQLEVIPVSALQGDNLVGRSERMPWYAGPTVAGQLELVEPLPPPEHLRAVFQLDSDRDGWTSLHLLSGELEDLATAWPEGRPCRVLERSPHGVGRVRLDSPHARGTLLTAPGKPAQVGTGAELIVTWLGPIDCTPQLQLQLVQHGRTTAARVSPLQSVSLESGALEATNTLGAGDVGRLRISLERATWFDRWEDSPVTGTALLVDQQGHTVAGARFT